MTPSFILYRWVWLLLFLRLSQQWASAQPSLPLGLQSHKLRQAQKLYRDGIAKNDSSLIAKSYYVYGRAYYLNGDYVAAQRYFLKSLRIQEIRGDSYEVGLVYIRLCDNEMAQYHYQESLQYVRIALATFQRIHSSKGLMRAYSLLAGIHSTSWSAHRSENTVAPKVDSALYYYRKLTYLAYKLNDSLEIASVAGHMGGLLASRKDPQGIMYLQTALAIYTKANVYGHRMYVLMGLASAYLTFGKHEPARQFLIEAQQLYADKHLNEYIMLKRLEENWIHYYQTIGDWKQAFAHQQKLHQLEKREAIADRQGAITRLNLEYETEKKEVILNAQKEELALHLENLLIQQRFIWAMSALLIVTVGMSLVFFRLYRRNQRISIQNAQLVREQNHRVKNNLQIVSSLLSLQANQLPDEAAKKAVEESQLRVQAMATLHRRLYDGDQLVRVNLPEFITELVEDVLEAFGYAYLQPVYDIQPISLSADDALPLGLILNELTTNACKYAFPNRTEPDFRVSCHQQHKTITLVVSDNGPGYSPTLSTDSFPKPLSFGMRLIQMQTNQLRGSYEFTMAGGTLFTLEFNV